MLTSGLMLNICVCAAIMFPPARAGKSGIPRDNARGGKINEIRRDIVAHQQGTRTKGATEGTTLGTLRIKKRFVLSDVYN